MSEQVWHAKEARRLIRAAVKLGRSGPDPRPRDLLEGAQIHATLAVADQLERLNARADARLRERLTEKLEGWINRSLEDQNRAEPADALQHQVAREAFEDVLLEVQS